MGDSPSQYCRGCGTPLAAEDQFCPKCGTSVVTTAAETGRGDTATTPPPAPADQPTAEQPAAVSASPSGPSTPPPGAPPPVSTGGEDGNGNRTMWITAVVVLIALIAGAIAFLALSGDDDDSADQAEGEIFLEAAASLGPDPFSDEVLEAEPVAVTSSSTTGSTGTTGTGPAAVASVEGGAPGLYGGTQNSARCDREAMVRFLEANPDKAVAWVAALNADPTLRWSGGTQVATTEIGTYIRELTPITLIRDTRVTNHGFRNGQPTQRQSVLQAGSAVLVDIYGVPRARCGCGNPLIPPQQVPVRPVYTGHPWPGWNPVNVVVVTQVNVQIDVFILVDVVTGDLFERAAGTTGDADVSIVSESSTTTSPPATTPVAPTTAPPDLGGGDVQVTLNWSGDADLDLHVLDPDGTEIYFGNPTSSSGGVLDFDKIPDQGDFGPHVENVFWPTGGAPAGGYQAWVVNLGGYGAGGPTDFTMDVFVDGELVNGDGGPLAEGDQSTPVAFSF